MYQIHAVCISATAQYIRGKTMMKRQTKRKDMTYCLVLKISPPGDPFPLPLPFSFYTFCLSAQTVINSSSTQRRNFEKEGLKRRRNYIFPLMMEFKLDWSLEESGQLTTPDSRALNHSHKRTKQNKTIEYYNVTSSLMSQRIRPKCRFISSLEISREIAKK